MATNLFLKSKKKKHLTSFSRFDVIYHLIGDLRQELGDLMPPIVVEDVVGRLTILEIKVLLD